MMGGVNSFALGTGLPVAALMIDVPNNDSGPNENASAPARENTLLVVDENGLSTPALDSADVKPLPLIGPYVGAALLDATAPIALAAVAMVAAAVAPVPAVVPVAPAPPKGAVAICAA